MIILSVVDKRSLVLTAGLLVRGGAQQPETARAAVLFKLLSDTFVIANTLEGDQRKSFASLCHFLLVTPGGSLFPLKG